MRVVAKVLGKSRERTKLTIKIEYDGKTFHVSPYSTLPSYCPFIDYVIDLDVEKETFDVVEAKLVKPKLKDVVSAAMRFGQYSDGKRAAKLLRGEKFLTQEWIDACPDWTLKEILADAIFESDFYFLLPRFASSFLKTLTEYQRSELAIAVELVPDTFEFWIRAKNALSFVTPIPDPRNAWKNNGKYQEGRPELSCWRNPDLNPSRLLLNTFFVVWQKYGLPQIEIANGWEELVKAGVLIKSGKLLLFPKIEHAENTFLEKLKDVRLISCSSRDTWFARKFQDLIVQDCTAFAPNRTWARELSALTGLKVSVLGEDWGASHIVLDMAHRASIYDLAKMRFKKITMIGDIHDETLHYWRGGCRTFHDLYTSGSFEKEEWINPEWVFRIQHKGIINRLISSFPTIVSLKTEKDCLSEAKRFKQMKAEDFRKNIRFCSSDYDRRLLHESDMSVGKDIRIHVLETDEVDYVQGIKKNGEILFRKKDKITKNGLNCTLFLKEGFDVDCRIVTLDTLRVCIASRYPGPQADIGTFYVGKYTKISEILGVMKYCRKKFELVLLPNVDISQIKPSYRKPSSFMEKIKYHF